VLFGVVARVFFKIKKILMPAGKRPQASLIGSA
jgi:hypothetical protein